MKISSRTRTAIDTVFFSVLTGSAIWLWSHNGGTVILSCCCLSAIWLYACFRTRNAVWRALWVNLLAVTIVLIGLEWYASSRQSTEEVTTWSNKPLFETDPARGYKAAPWAIRRVLKKNSGSTIYDTIYRYDENGLRLTPPPAQGLPGSLIFFGCSYTLGEGVQDNECFAYLSGQKSGLKAYNFGFHGYGTHNILAALESGAVAGAVKSPPAAVIYLALTCHIWRAAGLPQWNWNDFEYQLDETGKPHNCGPFSRPAVRFSSRWWKKNCFELCYRSATFRHVYERFYPKFIRREDLARFVAMTAAIRDRIKQLYPDADFTVILWTEKKSENDRIAPLLQQQGIKVVLIDDILPGLRLNEAGYRIAVDGHPSAQTHRLISDYIADKLIPKRQDAP